MNLLPGSKNNRKRLKNCSNHDAVEKRMPYVFRGLKVNVFIQEKNLKDNILIETPVPSNMQEVKKLEEFMLQLLKEKHKKALLAQDMIWKNREEKSGCNGFIRKIVAVFGTSKKRGENSKLF